MGRPTRSFVFVAAIAVLYGCSSALSSPDGARPPGTDGGAPITTDVPFVLPDVPTVDGSYVPMPGNCGFGDAAPPAFCENFEQGPMAGGRAGELDPARWS